MDTVTLIEQAVEDFADVTPCKFRMIRYVDGSSAGAVYSLCETYRYILWRIWDATLPLWMYCMLNPSTATEWILDPTIERQKRRSATGGAGGILVANAGAVRETKSALAVKHADPIGPDNRKWLEQFIPLADTHIAGWGPLASKFGGDRLVADVFRRSRKTLNCLEITKDGHPRHPLYTSYSVQPSPFVLP